MLRFAISIIPLVLIMVAVSSYYIPKTYRTIVDETFQAEGSYTFIVEREYDEDLHVYSRAKQEETNYNITLSGYSIRSLGPPLTLDRTISFMYNWELRSPTPPLFGPAGYKFDITPGSSFGDWWKLEIRLVGSGTVHLTISSFGRSNFEMFFYLDLVFAVFIVLFVFMIAYEYKLREAFLKASTQRLN